MKLSSPPTRWASTSVVAAAMKYGPTRVSRIAYELDMPVETCRYYLKRFYSAGFRFLPVVDYRALGLSPHVAFIRFSKQIDGKKRENFLRWLDSVYVVYRASLNQEHEYMLEVVPPKSDAKTYAEMLTILQESNVLEYYLLNELIDGYYKPEWVKVYDFIKECWVMEPTEVEIPSIPLCFNKGRTRFDKVDLIILQELEMETTTKMKKISKEYKISPQLLSYHRERHIEGSKLITGYVPFRRTAQEDVQYGLLNIPGNFAYQKVVMNPYLHTVWMTKHGCILRLHIPKWLEPTYTYPIYYINAYEVVMFTIPTEHFTDEQWTDMNVFLEELEQLVRTLTT
ncbi:MAG: hypothetical protein QXR26_02595 [Candidatus Caldarchaeum sp.]